MLVKQGDTPRSTVTGRMTGAGAQGPGRAAANMAHSGSDRMRQLQISRTVVWYPRPRLAGREGCWGYWGWRGTVLADRLGDPIWRRCACVEEGLGAPKGAGASGTGEVLAAKAAAATGLATCDRFAGPPSGRISRCSRGASPRALAGALRCRLPGYQDGSRSRPSSARTARKPGCQQNQDARMARTGRLAVAHTPT